MEIFMEIFMKISHSQDYSLPAYKEITLIRMNYFLPE